MITWRPYQTEIIEATFNDWQKHDSLLAVAGTGAGKTQVLWGITDCFLKDHPSARVCVLAHRKELIEQPKARLEQFWPERAWQTGIVMGSTNEPEKQIIIATVQTLGHKGQKRIDELLRFGKVDLLIIDEAHHVTSKGTYRNVIDRLKEANPDLKILGVTATPERADKKNLTDTFEKETANVGVRRLIEEGWLCEPRVHGVTTNIDLSGVSVVGSGAGRDYNQQQLVAAVETEDCFKIVVKTHIEKCGHRPTIAFVPSVAGAYRLAALLRENGIKAVAADATTPRQERTAIINGFRSGIYTTLINCALWTEGLDLPNLECCHVVRPTKSDSLYLQMVGRVLRTHPGKEYADIFDYQPKGSRNLDMRLRKLELKKKQAAATAGGGGGGSGLPKPKAGDRIEYILLDYFNKRKEAWIACETGWRIVGLGKGQDGIERSLAISPDGLQLWCAWRNEGERWHKAQLYLQGEFTAVSGQAEQFIKKHAVGRMVENNAPWRNKPPTDKQVVYARQRGVYRDGMTSGQISDAINEANVTAAIRRQLDKVATL